MHNTHCETSDDVGAELKAASVEQTDLRALVKHMEWVDAATPLDVVYSQSKVHGQEFCAVKKDGRLVGLCSSSQVSYLLGHRYGHAIFSQHPVGNHLVERPIIIKHGAPIRAVLEQTLGRQGKAFNEDVILVGAGADREYYGIITVPALVRLQSALVEERFRAQEQLHRRLLDVSRQAGMAEVATGILHNVGNVLNSVNVSVTFLREMSRKSKLGSLEKAAGLLREHRAQLGAYLTEDPKGKLLPDYFIALGEQVRKEHSDQLKEIESLGKHIDHIKNIVAMQQRFAKQSGLHESVQISGLVEDALELNANSFTRHGVTVLREFGEMPMVVVDRHKVLQILINLLRNAQQAVDHGNALEKRITIRLVSSGDKHVAVQVHDNGMGIAPENLNRIFGHGFTTKKDGHGFGLHSCALAAREMGGSLLAQSDGVGKGATFTLALPIEKVATAA